MQDVARCCRGLMSRKMLPNAGLAQMLLEALRESDASMRASFTAFIAPDAEQNPPAASETGPKAPSGPST